VVVRGWLWSTTRRQFVKQSPRKWYDRHMGLLFSFRGASSVPSRSLMRTVGGKSARRVESTEGLATAVPYLDCPVPIRCLVLGPLSPSLP